MKGDWQNQIFLATIDKLDDYYSANAEFIINTATIDENGYFVLQGDNLPAQSQFYRLYVIKEEHSEFNACLFVGGAEHNFIHLLLNNKSATSIYADTTTFAPFGDYQLSGDRANLLMQSLGRLVYPGWLFYEIKFPSELQFSQNKLNQDLFHFADTCSDELVALAAINNTDFDAYFQSNQSDYLNLRARLSEAHPNHSYLRDYSRKLTYYLGPPSYANLRIWQFLCLALLISVMVLLYVNKKLRGSNLSTPPLLNNKPAYQFTPQENRIVNLIKEGKSNKEIASELYIEVSTVKTHINKLYAKLGVKNRQEAIDKI